MAFHLSFETALLLKAFVAPLAVSAITAWLWSRYVREASAETLGNRLRVGLAWWLGSLIILAIQVQSLRFEETWQQADYLLWMVALVSSIASQKIKTARVWFLAGVFVVIMLYASLPRGDGWSDMTTTKYFWWSLGVIAWLVNAWCWPFDVDEAHSTSSGWFVWILLVYHAALTICSFSCYASLGAWSLSLLSMTIPLAVLASRFSVGSMRTVRWQVFAVGSLIAISAVLYGADPWAVALALFMPAFASLVDQVCGLWKLSRTWRIGMTAIGSSLILLVVVVLIGAS